MWILLSLIAASCQAISFTVGKKSLDGVSPLIAWLIPACLQLIIAWFVLWLFFTPQVHDRGLFLLFASITGGVNAYTTRSTYRAMQITDIGLIVPLFSFVVLFTALFGMLFLWEIPSLLWIIGMLTIMAWSYVLQRKKWADFWQPIKAIWTNKWVWIIFTNTLIRSVSNIFIKKGIEASNPMTFSFAFVFVITLWLIMMAYCQNSWSFFSIIKSARKRSWKYFSSVAVIKIIEWLSWIFAYSFLFVSYVISLKRVSGVIAVILWYLFLKEKNLKIKLIGSSIIIVWALMVTLGG